MLIAQNWLRSSLNGVLEATGIALDRGSESNLFAASLFTVKGLFHVLLVLFLLESALFLLKRDLNFRFLLGCFVSSWLID